MITCQDADVLAAALSVGSIEPDDQWSLEQHLHGCADCTRLAGEYMDAAAHLPLALEPLQPSARLRGRLMRAVYAEAAQAGRRQETKPQGDAWWRRLWAGVPSGRGFTVLAGAAAAALIALTTRGLANRPAPTPTAPPLALVSVALGPTAAAPQAHGQLQFQRGTGQAVLTVAGLPSPDSIGGGSKVYEVWLIRTDGSATPAAYLNQGPDGVWSAAVRADVGSYATVAATVEPQGGSLTPTGTKVVQGFVGSAQSTGGGSS